MDDAPLAAGALEGDGLAHPEADVRTAMNGSGHLEIPEANGMITGDGELEIALFELDGAVPGGEPALFPFDGDAVVGEWRFEIEEGCVRCIGRGDAGSVLVVVGLLNGTEQGEDFSFVGGCGGRAG